MKEGTEMKDKQKWEWKTSEWMKRIERKEGKREIRNWCKKESDEIKTDGKKEKHSKNDRKKQPNKKKEWKVRKLKKERTEIKWMERRRSVEREIKRNKEEGEKQRMMFFWKVFQSGCFMFKLLPFFGGLTSPSAVKSLERVCKMQKWRSSLTVSPPKNFPRGEDGWQERRAGCVPNQIPNQLCVKDTSRKTICTSAPCLFPVLSFHSWL